MFKIKGTKSHGFYYWDKVKSSRIEYENQNSISIYNEVKKNGKGGKLSNYFSFNDFFGSSIIFVSYSKNPPLYPPL